jgi:transposase
MAHIADHLSIEELEEGYRACADACSARHYHTIWLLAQGHTVLEVSALTSFVPRWIEELQSRYNALGPQALGDLRRNNGTSPTVLKPELLEKLKLRLKQPPPDGGLWTSGKVAAFMAEELGLERLAPQRGWEALKAIGWSIQSPRPRNPNSATEDQARTFKKTSTRRLPRKPPSIRASPSRSGRRMSIGSA